MMPLQVSRNYGLDIVRAIAAFMVVIFHLNEPISYVDNWYRNIVKFGWLGVPVFFVISGYCIMLSAFKSKKSGVFLLRRFFRIFPPYWISLLIILLIAIFQKVITGYNSVNHLPNTFIEILANITLLTKPFSNVETINWVYWSLTYELFFYLTVALTLFLPSRFWMAFLSLISILSIFASDLKFGPLFFVDAWPTFSLGLSIYCLHFIQGRKGWLYFVFLSAVSIYGIAVNFALKNQIEYLYAALATYIFIIASPYLQIHKNILTRIGDYSYSVYLLHVPIGVFVWGRTKTLLIQNNVIWNIVYDFSIYVIICAISHYFFNYIELSSIEIGKKNSIKFNKKQPIP